MAGSLNKVQLIGNVGKDPEIRSMQDGKEMASLTIATSDTWRDKASGEKKEKTEWHRVAVFSEGLVSVIKNYVKKGTKVYVEGTLQTRKWTDTNNQERYTTEVVLQGFGSSLVLLGSKPGAEGAGAWDESKDNFRDKTKASSSLAEELEDEMPF